MNETTRNNTNANTTSHDDSEARNVKNENDSEHSEKERAENVDGGENVGKELKQIGTK